VLVEMLSGQALFAGTDEVQLMEEHLTAPRSPNTWPVEIPWQLGVALERALAVDPAARFPNLVDMINAPDKIVSEVSENEEERARREAEVKARREARLEARERIRLEAEETARLAALQKARLEIEEQVRRESEAGSLLIEPNREELTPQETIQEIRPASRAGERPKNKRPAWSLWAVLGLLAIVLIGLWLGYQVTAGSLLSRTPTPTASKLIPAPSTTFTASPHPSATPSKTATLTATFTATASLTETPTTTFTNTPTLTASSTPTRTPTPTRQPRDNEDSGGG
jgi:hypothetical protein